MQTFLPYPSFEQSAKVLDNKRLGKQRVETWQILNALLTGPTSKVQIVKDNDVIYVDRKTPWFNHPATRMWNGYESLLAYYGLVMCREWINRGFNDNLKDRFIFHMSSFDIKKKPTWLGDESFHASHRSNLLRKDPKHYSQFGWTESPNMEYVWPV